MRIYFDIFTKIISHRRVAELDFISQVFYSKSQKLFEIVKDLILECCLKCGTTSSIL